MASITHEEQISEDKRELDLVVEELVPVELKEWTDAFVYRLTEWFHSQADQRFVTDKSPAKFEYDINADIWSIALQRFDFVQMLRDKFGREDIEVELTEIHSRRVLKVTIPWYDYEK